MVRHRGATVVTAGPCEVATGEEVWSALEQPATGPPLPYAMAGGWIGLLGYELAGTIERLPTPAEDPLGPPVGALARYETVAIVHADGHCDLVTVAGEYELDRFEKRAGATPMELPEVRGGKRIASSLPGHAYDSAVQAVRELIGAGDVFEVNVAQRLEADWSHDAPALASRLWKSAGPTSHRAYLKLPGGAVVSASPERLVAIDRGRVVSEPIKGTAAPGAAGELGMSEKDRAEHVMIVDLVRNDLGRIARTGSVGVERLMAPYSIGYAEHLVSRVSADVASGSSVGDVVRAVFPGGSVTGAPKVRAMEIIGELEPVARGPAFGSVIALGRDGSLEASVAIRTAWVRHGRARYWCGGAVTWGSDPAAERNEAWDKAAPFRAAVSHP